MLISGIILAAGKGTRMKSSETNKTALDVNGKALINYGVDLFDYFCKEICIVVGAYADSVKSVVTNKKVFYAVQEEQLGTAHAVHMALEEMIEKSVAPDALLVGYGDHLYGYSIEALEKIIIEHRGSRNAITLVTTTHEDPNSLAWGRIIRNSDGKVTRIVEQKNATEEEKLITELNTGFYVFDTEEAYRLIPQIEPNSVTGEYYLTDAVEIALKENKKVGSCLVDFGEVGLGVNTPEQLEKLKAGGK